MKTNAIIAGIFLGAATLVSCSDENESIEPQPSSSSTVSTSNYSAARTAVVTLQGQFTVLNYMYRASDVTSKFKNIKMNFLSSGELIVYNGESKYRGYFKHDQANGALYIDIQSNDDLVNLLASNPWKVRGSDSRDMKLISVGREEIREMTIRKSVRTAPSPAPTGFTTRR